MSIKRNIEEKTGEGKMTDGRGPLRWLFRWSYENAINKNHTKFERIM